MKLKVRAETTNAGGGTTYSGVVTGSLSSKYYLDMIDANNANTHPGLYWAYQETGLINEPIILMGIIMYRAVYPETDMGNYQASQVWQNGMMVVHHFDTGLPDRWELIKKLWIMNRLNNSNWEGMNGDAAWLKYMGDLDLAKFEFTPTRIHLKTDASDLKLALLVLKKHPVII